MIEHTIANGGGTFDLSGEPMDFSKGFMVGAINLGITTPEELEDLLATGVLTLETMSSSHYLGTWVDDSGAIHVDISQYETDRNRALKLARDRGELAIWDCANGTEIYCRVA